MKITEKELNDAILTVANRLDATSGIKIYEVLIKNYQFVEIIMTLTYDMFVNNYSEQDETDDKVIKALQLIRASTKELNELGFVNFEKEL